MEVLYPAVLLDTREKMYDHLKRHPVDGTSF